MTKKIKKKKKEKKKKKSDLFVKSEFLTDWKREMRNIDKKIACLIRSDKP